MMAGERLEDKMYNKTIDKLRRNTPIIRLVAHGLMAGTTAFLAVLTVSGSLAWGIATAVGFYAVVVAYLYGEHRGFKRGMLVKHRE